MQLTIELNGFNNSPFAKPSDTFTITTKTEEGYLVDFADDGMYVNSQCDWPCMDCTLEDPSECRKCFTDPEDPFPLYFDGQCIDTCPAGFFKTNNVCSKCHEGCLECDESSKKCLKCHAGRYLLGNQCFDVCPTTHHGIDETRTCELCNAPCETCLGSLDFCLTCDQT